MFMKIENDHRFEPLQLKPLEVKVDDYGSFEEALKAFRLKVNKERVMSICKEHSAYEKPSIKKRRKMREAAHRRFLESLPLRQPLSQHTEES